MSSSGDTYELAAAANGSAGGAFAGDRGTAPLPGIQNRQQLGGTGKRALIVDLNNFASFPTLAIGLLVASLRNAGHDVHMLSPLAYDAPGSQRERQETLRDHLMRRMHASLSQPLRVARDAARQVRRWWITWPHPGTLREVERALDRGVDIVLLSAYLQHYPMVRKIAALAKKRGTPLLLGGPMFNLKDTANAWRGIPGLTAVVGAEADVVIPELVRAACEGGDLLAFDGVVLPDGRRSRTAPPLRDLAKLPVPDFSDFPWDRYPQRVIPIMSGRGCQWARCMFCSDVVSANGRTFRSRKVESVLQEMREQSRRHQTANFLFLDIKLNSNPAMFRGIAEDAQRYVDGAQWIGAVHVDLRKDNGLSRRDLRTAVSGGMRRVSFGLESGSQRILDAMDKGCSVEANAEFVHHAHEAGLSVRCTMFMGFPGEDVDDLRKTAGFLQQHGRCIDRIRYNEFKIMEDTPINAAIRKDPQSHTGVQILRWNHRDARAVHAGLGTRAYRREKIRVLKAIYEINRRPLRQAAHAFDGMM